MPLFALQGCVIPVLAGLETAQPTIFPHPTPARPCASPGSSCRVTTYSRIQEPQDVSWYEYNIWSTQNRTLTPSFKQYLDGLELGSLKFLYRRGGAGYDGGASSRHAPDGIANASSCMRVHLNVVSFCSNSVIGDAISLKHLTNLR